MILGRVVGAGLGDAARPAAGANEAAGGAPARHLRARARRTRHLVATDEVHAGIGDEVVVCLGMPARASLGSNDTPVDAAILGVVDRIELDRRRSAGSVGGGAGDSTAAVRRAAALLRAQVGR